MGFDGMFGLAGGKNFVGKLDRVRLRDTILSRAPHLQLYGLAAPNETCEFKHQEVWRPSWHIAMPGKKRAEDDYDVETWPAYRWMTSVVVPEHWATIGDPEKSYSHLNADQLYRYTVLQAAAAVEGPGCAWAASPYADGTWERGVREAFAGVAAAMRPVRESLTRVYPSTSYRTRDGDQIATLAHGIVATKTTDDSVEYIHVLNPPDDKTLALPPPADGKRFLNASLLDGGAPVALKQDAEGVTLVLGDNSQWHRLNTVIALRVDPQTIPRRNLALHRKVTASDTRYFPKWPPKLNSFALVRLVDGERHMLQKTHGRMPHNYGWSSEATGRHMPRWVAVDLGEECEVSEVRLYPRDDEGGEGIGLPVALTIETSLDAETWHEVASREDLPKSSDPVILTFEPVKARYVRVVGEHHRPEPTFGMYIMQFVELEVYGPEAGGR
jgi:hypothetical protein